MTVETELADWAEAVGKAGRLSGGLLESIDGLNVTLRIGLVGNARDGDLEFSWASEMRGVDSDVVAAIAMLYRDVGARFTVTSRMHVLHRA